MGRIGIDVGGTFTDAVIVSDDGEVRIAKVRSTPERIEAGFMDGLRSLLDRAGAAAGDVDYVAHGSTVARNAIVQRRLARTGLITNEGFRDVVAIGTFLTNHPYMGGTHTPDLRVSRRSTGTAPWSPGRARSPTTSTSAAASSAPRAPSAPSSSRSASSSPPEAPVAPATLAAGSEPIGIRRGRQLRVWPARM
jgi:hypothetical protein